MEEKERFPLASKSVSPMVSASRKKSLNKRILFEIDRKLVLISGNGEFVEETFLLDEKTGYVDRNI